MNADLQTSRAMVNAIVFFLFSTSFFLSLFGLCSYITILVGVKNHHNNKHNIIKKEMKPSI